MSKEFLIEPSKDYKDKFKEMVQDYEKYGEIEKFNMYKEALEDFDNYIRNLIDNSDGIGLPEGWVPCNTYWLINNYDKILGVIRIRKELNLQKILD